MQYFRHLLKHQLYRILLCAAVLLPLSKAGAQVVTYTLVSPGTATTLAQCQAWNTFRSQLLAYPYYRLRFSGTMGAAIECNNPAMVQDIADKLRNLPGAASANAFSWVDGANTWRVGTDIMGRFGVNVPDLSGCPNPGWILKPGIGHTNPPTGTSTNGNWGGFNTNTCPGPAQTVTLEFFYGPPCPVITGLATTSVFGYSVTFSWSPVTGSVGYDYVVDQNSTGPTGTPAPTPTSATSGSAVGLSPNTQYYIHVRNKCSGSGISTWVTLPFKTLPPCDMVTGFKTVYVKSDSASFIWNAGTNATSFQYVVDQSRNAPTASTPKKNTTALQGNQNGLTEGQTYYVHVRVKCVGDDSSGWSLDSFYTPITCRTPDVKFTDIGTDQAVAYWSPVLTAEKYEFAITKSATPPVTGTPQPHTSRLLPFLDDGDTHYFHIRSLCVDRGVSTTSDWKSYDFKTIALGLKDVDAQGSDVSIYPNPVGEQLNISAGRLMTKVTVIGIDGRMIKAFNINDVQAQLNISGIAAGTYMLKITDAENRNVFVKFSKQ